MAMLQEDLPNITIPVDNYLQTAKDLTAGAIGGAVQVIIGQPFDLVKVRLQTQGGDGIWNTANSIWKKEGPLAFYKGTLAPLIGNGACVSIQFGAFHAARHALEAYNREASPGGPDSLSLAQLYLAGGTAGLANSILSGPVEHVRIRLQTQPHGQQRLYSGPGDCLQAIVRQSGLAGIYRGQEAVLLREIQGYGMYFATFECLMRLETNRCQQRRQDLPGWKVALCGGIAGNALWLSMYPLDVVKTKVQSDGFGSQRLYENVLDAGRKTWQQDGLKGFFRGLSPALVRTMFTSAGTFAAVEYVRSMIS